MLEKGGPQALAFVYRQEIEEINMRKKARLSYHIFLETAMHLLRHGRIGYRERAGLEKGRGEAKGEASPPPYFFLPPRH